MWRSCLNGIFSTQWACNVERASMGLNHVGPQLPNWGPITLHLTVMNLPAGHFNRTDCPQLLPNPWFPKIYNTTQWNKMQDFRPLLVASSMSLQAPLATTRGIQSWPYFTNDFAYVQLCVFLLEIKWLLLYHQVWLKKVQSPGENELMHLLYREF